MKLSALSFANAGATTGAVLWITCALIAILLPGLYKTGTDLLSFGDVGHFSLTFPSAILGGVLFTIICWIAGYLFGWNLMKFSKK